eukprot:GHVN01068510.1.p2 GENE.GHVN01068510.1~~GHVN01068510.1.p2  ORF type:complete len:187 (-),score=32.21 GHVN01068510.1:735-1295(-)
MLLTMKEQGQQRTINIFVDLHQLIRSGLHTTPSMASPVESPYGNVHADWVQYDREATFIRQELKTFRQKAAEQEIKEKLYEVRTALSGVEGGCRTKRKLDLLFTEDMLSEEPQALPPTKRVNRTGNIGDPQIADGDSDQLLSFMNDHKASLQRMTVPPLRDILVASLQVMVNGDRGEGIYWTRYVC